MHQATLVDGTPVAVKVLRPDISRRIATDLAVLRPLCRFIARQGYDPVYGARPLRRYIAREVETRVGRAMIAGDVADGAVIRIDVVDDELVVDYDDSAPAHATGIAGQGG